jgi:hypothetical protein|tara:strand:- start:6452 stop:6886 length:435 start_codon:yes stop_codon:yes gene_type:complete
MKSVVICGSLRYASEIDQFAARLRKLGAPLVLTPNFKYLRKEYSSLDEKDRLTSKGYRRKIPELVLQHFDRIRKADIVFVYNKDGYLGVNTTLELGFAHGRDMIIYSLEPESAIKEGGEVCRDILFTEVINTPEDLCERLKYFR